MNNKKVSIGLDYGTESARALIVDVQTGEEISTAAMEYPNGVMQNSLPDGTLLEPESALQDPNDYLLVLSSIIPEAINKGNITAERVISLGIDFTASTVLPTTKDGTPLCNLSEFNSEPYAWVKLWKDHTSQPEAEEMNVLAEKRGEAFLRRYGRRLSSEWMFPKALRMLRKAPYVYSSMDRFIEAGDWLVWQLTGNEKRSACQAGYKGMWSKSDGYPSCEYLNKLDDSFSTFVIDKLDSGVHSLGRAAGGLQPEWADKLGLIKDTQVAISIIDAHAAVFGSAVYDSGKMVLALGTSTCHLVMNKENIEINGVAGIVEDGIVPGYAAYESGQSAVGDIFLWFIRNYVSNEYFKKAKEQNLDIFKYFEILASKVSPGSNGLLALDWWNGNRSTLMDADLSGLFIGLTLSTIPEEIYRALIEATAFGTLAIIDNHVDQGINIDELYATGGLAEKNELLLQIYADVTGRKVKVAKSTQAAALGAAIIGSVAAGVENNGYNSFEEAVKSMAKLKDYVFQPDKKNNQLYQEIYAEYKILYKEFGSGIPRTMKNLKRIRNKIKNEKD